MEYLLIPAFILFVVGIIGTLYGVVSLVKNIGNTKKNIQAIEDKQKELEKEFELLRKP